MNPLLAEALASIVRHVLTIGAGFLVTSGVWTDSDALRYVAAASLAVVGIGWGLYQKYVSRSKLVTALASPRPVTEAVVEAMVKNPRVTTPSTSTPKDAVPQAGP